MKTNETKSRERRERKEKELNSNRFYFSELDGQCKIIYNSNSLVLPANELVRLLDEYIEKNKAGSICFQPYFF